jgi:ribosomal protein S19
MAISRIFKKNLRISFNDINKKILIYNGKDFQKLIILKSMVGKRFGEFVSTRKVVPFKKK